MPVKRSARILMGFGTPVSVVINTFPVNSTSTVVVCSYLDSEDVLTFGPGSTAANPSYLHYIASNPLFIRTFGVHDR